MLERVSAATLGRTVVTKATRTLCIHTYFYMCLLLIYESTSRENNQQQLISGQNEVKIIQQRVLPVFWGANRAFVLGLCVSFKAAWKKKTCWDSTVFRRTPIQRNYTLENELIVFISRTAFAVEKCENSGGICGRPATEFLIHGRQPEVTISALQSMRMR